MLSTEEKIDVQYQVFLENPGSHQLKIILTIQNPDEIQKLWMPTWIPGSYKIRDYAKHITHISASDELGELNLEKLDPHRWLCRPRQGGLVITYYIYAFERSVRGAHFDKTHAFLNGCAIFLGVEGKDSQPQQVTFSLPDDEAYQHWKIATTLPKSKIEPGVLGVFQAENYDALLDYPIEIGDFDHFEWDSHGCTHALVITGAWQGDSDRIVRDLKRLCDETIAFFGAPAPIKQYLFLLTVTESECTGLEHRDSTALLCGRYDFPKIGQSDASEGYQRLLGLFSHEYFHAWHVKRIKPAVFSPYNLTKPNYTDQLWIYEGFTAYYDDLILLRSKLISPQQYWKLQEKNITRFLRTNGRYYQSVAESSFDAWIKFYQPTENSHNSEVSYYNKGSLIAFCLDIAMRSATNQRISLDALMYWLWETYGKSKRGTASGAVEEWVEQNANPEIALALRQWVYQPGDLPLEETFKQLGIDFSKQSSDRKQDKAPKLTLGLQLSFSHGVAKVERIESGGPAEKAGISPGDTLVALGHIQVDSKNYGDLLDYQAVGVSVPVHIFRDKVLSILSVVPELAPKDSVTITWDVNRCSEIAKQWMHY